MSVVLRFIGGAWTFFWRQPALQRATFALVFLPMLAMGYLDLSVDVARTEQAAVFVVLYIAALAALTWGIACTLVVGKRLLQAKAGRLRTSFRAVRGHAKGLIIPLLLTDILRACIAVLWGLPAAGLAFAGLATLDLNAIAFAPFADSRPFWYLSGVSLLLLLPVLYLVRTSLAAHVVAYEKLTFRQALRRSAELTRKRMGRTLVVTAVLGLFWLPGIVANTLFALYATPLVVVYAAPAVSVLFDSLAIAIWYLGLTQFYKALGGRVRQAHPDNDDE